LIKSKVRKGEDPIASSFEGGPHMAKRITDYDIPDGYSGPEIIIVTKNPNNHKTRYRRATERNDGYEKLYLVEKVLRKCKYFEEPSTGLVFYWNGADELAEIVEWVLKNPSMWEFSDLEDDVSSLNTIPFDENFFWHSADRESVELSREGESENGGGAHGARRGRK